MDFRTLSPLGLSRPDLCCDKRRIVAARETIAAQGVFRPVPALPDGEMGLKESLNSGTFFAQRRLSSVRPLGHPLPEPGPDVPYSGLSRFGGAPLFWLKPAEWREEISGKPPDWRRKQSGGTAFCVVESVGPLLFLASNLHGLIDSWGEPHELESDRDQMGGNDEPGQGRHVWSRRKGQCGPVPSHGSIPCSGCSVKSGKR